MDAPLTPPPLSMAHDQVCLRFQGYLVGEHSSGIYLGYHFRILDSLRRDAGHVNFRVGDTERIRFCVGHIGYSVRPEHRGRGYALQACRAMAAFVSEIKGSVIITADSENIPSIRTIERLGAVFLDEYPVPVDDLEYLSGSRIKLRYWWRPESRGKRGVSSIEPDPVDARARVDFGDRR